MSGFARPSRWSISTSTAIAWPLKGRSVRGGRKTASTDQINRQGYRIPSGFRLDFDRNRRKSQRFLDRYKISLLCRASLKGCTGQCVADRLEVRNCRRRPANLHFGAGNSFSVPQLSSHSITRSFDTPSPASNRSEERRGGKECR